MIDLENLHYRLDSMVIFGLDIGTRHTGGVRMVGGEIVADCTLKSQGDGLEMLLSMGAAIAKATRSAHLLAIEKAYVGENMNLAIGLATVQGMILRMGQERGQTVRLLTTAEIDAALGISNFHRRLNADLIGGVSFTRKEALLNLCKLETGKKFKDQHRIDAWAVARAAWLREQRRMIEEVADEPGS